MSKTRQHFDFEMKPKNNNTFSHMLLDHYYAFGLFLYPSGLNRKFLKEETPRDLFLPRPGSAESLQTDGRQTARYDNSSLEPPVS